MIAKVVLFIQLVVYIFIYCFPWLYCCFRKYTNGSVLRMHVDTVNTHVVSAIINVDQDVDEDWPLLILDHDDNEHTLIMKPGDMVLYESAKLLHGRPGKYKIAFIYCFRFV